MGATGKQRRSTRVLVNIPLLVSGLNSRGEAVEAGGETLVVNKHGAKVRVLERLEKGMRLKVTLPTRKLTRPAQVVWVDDRDQTEAELEFGVELESPENFWGIYFPPEDWEEVDPWQKPEAAAEPPAPLPARPLAAGEIRGAAANPAATLPSSPSASLSASSSASAGARASGDGHLAIPAKGAVVFVRGMSAVHIPFQEKTTLRPVGQGEATIDVRPVVDVGVTLQVIFPESQRGLKARTSAVGEQRHEGRWRMWIKFLDPVEFAAPPATA